MEQPLSRGVTLALPSCHARSEGWPCTSLHVVLDKFAGQPMQSLPVIDPAHPNQVHELVTRAAVMTIYHRSLDPTTTR